MSVRRLALAAFLFFAVSYLNLFLPAFSRLAIPALRQAFETRQTAVYVPETWLPWLTSG